jgi:hypothetical protein
MAVPVKWGQAPLSPPRAAAKRAIRAVRPRLPPWPPPSSPTALRTLNPPDSLWVVVHRARAHLWCILAPTTAPHVLHLSVRLSHLGTLLASICCSPRLPVSVPPAVDPLNPKSTLPALLTGVLTKGYSRRVLKKGYSKRVTQKGVIQKRGTQKGVFNGAEKLLRCLAAVFAGYWWAVRGSVRHSGAMACVVWPYTSGTHGVLPCVTGEHARVCAGSADVQPQKSTHTVLTRYSHGTAHPAEHAALLRVLVAVSVGRSGQCTAVWGTPEYDLCGMAPASTHRVLQRTHRVFTRAVHRMVRCATPPGRGPTSHSVAHVCGTTACTLRWVSGIHSTAERTKGTHRVRVRCRGQQRVPGELHAD